MYIDGLFSFIQYVFGLDLLLRPQRRTEIGAIKTGDIGDGDLLGAFRLAGGDVGAAAEALVVHLLDHVQDTLTVLDIALGQQSEVADLGGDEQHGRRIRTSCHASAATDASRRLKGQGSLFLLYRNGIAVRRLAGIHGYITTRLDDPVKGRPVYRQVLDHREGFRPVRLDSDGIPILVFPHMQLAGGRALPWTMRLAIDHHAAGSADALPTVMVERHRLFLLGDQAFI